MRHSVVPVVLCGGSGTRLWPLSRAGFPKQFLVLTGSTSLYQQAVERINGSAASDIAIGKTLVVTNDEHRFLALEQLREIGSVDATLLLEPEGRNTAPALTLAALQAMSDGEDPILVVTPADQTVEDSQVFKNVLQNGVRVASSGATVVLGITPTRPETGYGYILAGGEAAAHGDFEVIEFAEKPDLAIAQSFLASGKYAWNSGIFVLKASTWLKAVKIYCPEMASSCQRAWAENTKDGPFIRPEKKTFATTPARSIDYAVVEHCPRSTVPVRMLHLSAGWYDLGAWDAVWQVGDSDLLGNVVRGDVFLADTKNSLVHATSRLVAAVGLSNIVIVETPDAVLVADKASSQGVKEIAAQLDSQKREEHTLHRKVHRPWGWYDSIDEEKRFKVKRIQVKPGASLSLQMHHHRAEHWIVVSGIAEITCGDKTVLLSENQSVYIPIGQMHRLANPGTIPLEIIEVQSGSYLGEDDIIRFEDTYGRALNS